MVSMAQEHLSNLTLLNVTGKPEVGELVHAGQSRSQHCGGCKPWFRRAQNFGASRSAVWSKGRRRKRFWKWPSLWAPTLSFSACALRKEASVPQRICCNRWRIKWLHARSARS